MPKIDFLIALIECGYVEKNLPSHMISTNTNDCQWMKERHADACAGKAFSMWHQGNYEVTLYGKKIPIYGLKIFIEIFEIDVEDLQYKIETYREGDARNRIYYLTFIFGKCRMTLYSTFAEYVFIQNYEYKRRKM